MIKKLDSLRNNVKWREECIQALTRFWCDAKTIARLWMDDDLEDLNEFCVNYPNNWRSFDDEARAIEDFARETAEQLQGKEVEKKPTESMVIVWHRDDVKAVGENLGLKEELTDEQCGKVLDLMKKSLDASLGVNWETIESAIEVALGNLPKKDEGDEDE